MFNANCDWSILIDVLVWGFGNLTLVRSKKGPWFLLLGTLSWCPILQYIPRNMHTVFALLCFVVVIHWLIFPYPSGLLHWHCGNLTIAPVPAKQPWWIWINISCGFIMNDCITITKQSTTKPCAYLLGYTVCQVTATHVITKWRFHMRVPTEALKGHRVLWKNENCYLIRMT